MAHSILIASVFAVLIISVGVSAKRGCSAFGHSCFGGHGKRSDSSLDSSNSEVLGGRQLGQAETPPHPGYPHPYGVLAAGDDIIPVRDGGAYDRDGPTARDAMKLKLRNILRYWMDYYRRSRQSNDDGYLFETV
ncbi:neuropeptide CCHamide-2 [Maniola hyperantus]|uniref:neuropeptide CCHamide-2 n=1 Tax=Aphantopus hyperantus TaxID=2795564 RepID=UPI001568B2E9|nr:neuropeptide CCHamide-2 [Maniola hyperantus]